MNKPQASEQDKQTQKSGATKVFEKISIAGWKPKEEIFKRMGAVLEDKANARK